MPQDVREHIGRDAGLATDHQRVDHEDGDDAHMLDSGDEDHQRRRRFLNPIDKICRFSHEPEAIGPMAVMADDRPP